MTDSHVRLLVVDDEESLRIPLKRYLERNFGYQVDAVDNSTAALEQARTRNGGYDVALIDEVLVDGLDGIETMQELQALYPELEVIIFTGWGAQSKQRALRAGAFRYLEKPVNYDELAMVIRTAAQQVRLQEIGRVILAERDRARVLEQIAGAANSLALGDEAAIVLQEPHTHRLAVHAHSNGVQWQRHFVDRWASREIIDASRVVWVPDTEGETGVHPEVIQAGIRSFLGVPIPGPDGNLGALYVYSNKPGRFEDWGTVSVLQTLAGHAGLALTNVQAFDQVHAQATGMESLVQAARELTTATKLEDQLEITWDFVREQLGASTFFVSLYDESTDTVSFPLFYDEYELVPIAEKTLGDETDQWGTTGWVVKHGKELHWSSVEQKEQQCRRRGIHPSTVGKPCQSCFFLPLTRGEQVIGVVSIQSYEQYAFDSVLLNTFRALGSQLVAAMENTRLLESEARRRREAETLREATLTLTTTLELQEIFERILSELQKVVPYDSASVQLLRGDWLEVIGGRGFPNPEEIIGLSFPLDGDNPNREVIRRRDWFIVSDGPASYRGFIEEPCLAADIRGWLGVPMVVGDRIVGMITLDKHEPGFYNAEHARLAQTFATQAAVAVENGRLFSELGAAMEWRGALIEHAFDALIAIDEDRRITVFNRQAEMLFGRTAEDVSGQRVSDLYVDIERAREVDRTLEQAGSISGWEVEVKHHDGTPVPVLLSATVLRDSSGHPIGHAGFMRDRRQVRLLEGRLRALIDLSQTVTSSLELDEVLSQVMRAAWTAFPAAQHGGIHLYDDHSALLCLRANTNNYGPEAIQASCMKPGEGIAGWVFRKSEPVVVEDTAKDPRFKWIEHPEVPVQRSMICVPLRVKNRVIGTLSLDNLETTGAFQASDLDLVSTFADQAAIAIDNARLYRDTARREQLLAALDEASRHIRAEKESAKLLHEMVRLAVQLVDGMAGCLLVNHPQLGSLEMQVAYGPLQDLVGCRIQHEEGLSGLVATTGRVQVVQRPADGPQRETLLAPYDLGAVAGLPLVQAGVIEAVLLICGGPELLKFSDMDLEVLERFVQQATIAWQASRLMSQEQRMLSQLGILHRISDYIQAARNLDKILHVVLTGVTAGYGLGFNRAALFLMDERQEYLLGRMGIGHLDEPAARQDWAQYYEQGMDDFRHYLELLETDALDLTPIGERIQGLRVPVPEETEALFRRVMDEQGCITITEERLLQRLPGRFIEAFEPSLPLIMAPLLSRNRVIGILVADNKFTQTPITEADQEAALTFANTAAVAIDNAQLYHEAEAERERLKAFYAASAELVSSRSFEKVLHDIVEQARLAADAQEVIMILIDAAGRVRILVTARLGTQVNEEDLIRRDGLSMEVMATGQVQSFEDSSLDRDRVNPSVFRRGIVAGVCLPVILEGERIGVMWFHYDQPRAFAHSEMEAMQLYVNQATLAYDSAQRIRELEHMQEAAATVAGVEDLHNTLDRIAQSARSVLEADSAALWSYDDVRQQFVPDELAFDGIEEEDFIKFRKMEPMPGGTAQTVMARGWVGIEDVKDPSCWDFTMGPSTRDLLEQIGARSFQGTVLRVGEERLGVLYANYRRPQSFDEAKRRTLETFANHASLALKNARLLAQVERIRRTAEIIAGATVQEDLRQTLKTIAEHTRQALRSDAVTIYAYDDEKRLFHEWAYDILDSRDPSATCPPERLQDTSATQRILDLANPPFFELAENRAAEHRCLGGYYVKQEGFHASFGGQLRIGERIVGVLFVNYRTAHRFTSDEIATIQLFADQAALAIRNAQLYQRSQDRAMQLATAAEVARDATSNPGLQELLNQVVRLISERFGFYHAAVFLLDEEKEFAVLQAASSPGGQRILKGGHRLRVGSPSIVGHVTSTGVHYVARDVRKDPLHLENGELPETMSEVAFPLTVREQIIGALDVQSIELGTFTREYVTTLQTLAGQIANAIENARLYEALEKSFDDLQRAQGLVAARTALAWMGMLSSSWRHAIDGHAISIREQAQHLRTDLGQELPVSDRLDTIRQLAGKILDKPITPPLSNEEGVESVPIGDMVQERLTQLWSYKPYNEAKLKTIATLEDGATVRASPEWLREALDALIDNAVDAMQASKTKQVLVSIGQARGGAEISITDSGSGIPEEVQPKLLHEPIRKAKGVKGQGMGLLMAQMIVQAYGGDISIKGTGPDGTTMAVWLPLEA